MTKKIFLGLTTTPGSDYKKKVEETKKFGITEIALFLTAINQEKRKLLCGLLEDTPVKNIPLVHLRDDMELWELEYLEERFSVQAFNVHCEKDPHNFKGFWGNLNKFVDKILIENTESVPRPDELTDSGGLCVNFSHWQDGILLQWNDYKNGKMAEVVRNFPIVASHISGIGKEVITINDVGLPGVAYKIYSKHYFDDLNEFDYIRNFIDYLPEIICLELENSFEDQLKAKDYLEEIIKKHA